MEHWAGVLLLERGLTIAAAGYCALHFLSALRRPQTGAGGHARSRRAVRAAQAAMLLFSLALLAGAAYPLAAARFALVSDAPVWEAAASAAPLAASLLLALLVMRSRK